MKSLFRRINAARAFTWQAFFWMGLGLIFFSPGVLLRSYGSEPENWRAILLVTLVILAVITFGLNFFLLKKQTIGEKPLISWVLLIGLSVLFPVIFRIVSSEIFGLSDFRPGFIRYVTNSVAWLLGTLLFAVVVHETREFRDGISKLRSQLETAHRLEREEQNTLENLRSTVIAKVKETLKQAFSQITPKTSSAGVSTQLQHLLDEVVRPLASSLRNGDQVFTTDTTSNTVKFRVSVREVASRLAYANPFEYKWTPFLVALPTFSMKTWVVPIPTALLSVGCSAFFLMGALSLAHYVFDKYEARFTKPNFAAILVAIFLIIGLLDSGIAMTVMGLELSTVGLLIAFAEFGILIMLAVLRAVPLERKRLLSDIDVALDRVNWMNSRRGQLIWIEQLRVARLVHGDIQARILATFLEISLTMKNGRITQSQIKQLQQNCEAALDYPATRGSISDFLDSLTKIWAASIEITSTISPEANIRIGGDPVALEAVSEIVVEALNNAVKHSHATVITISIEIEQLSLSLAQNQPFSLLRVEVVSDARGIGSTGDRGDVASGQGTALYEQLSIEWNLYRTGDLSRLEARVPLVSGIE